MKTNLAATIAAAALLVTAAASCSAASTHSVAAQAPRACPAKARTPVNTWPAARSALLPSGARRLRLCRYALGHDGLALRHDHVLRTAATIASITRQIDELPHVSRSSTPTACPSDSGESVVIQAAYSDGHNASVIVGLSGCRVVSNGHHALDATAIEHEDLLRHLRRLTA